jgi:NAD(P)-dependent dehydrogenase (short-subunit alcohol dehydrogenase family)
MNRNQKWTAKLAHSQEGKIALVTGANSGLGFYTCCDLTALGAEVIMAVRDLSRGSSALETIKEKYPSAKLHLLQLDLASLKSIRDFVEIFKNKFSKFNLLINNAGVMMCPFQKTEDNFEMQFGTNHLGHFALTALLFDRLINEIGSRIVTVSSYIHHFGKIDFNNLNAEKKYRKTGAYSMSKLANLLFANELDRRLKRKLSKIISVSAHPGYSATNLQQHVGLFKFFNPYIAQDAEMGSLPTQYAALSENIYGGDFIGPDGFMELKGYPKKVKSSKSSYNEKLSKKLWEISEILIKIKFEI